MAMHNTAPGAERIAGGGQDHAAPAAQSRKSARWGRWAAVAGFLLVIAVLFDAYLHVSKTYAENSDEANILLMAHDMLHGNVILHGWSVSDVPFISTELPQIALLVWMFGLHLNTAHIAAALTYTLIVAVAMLLAKGRARGWAAVARMALVLGIMIAPQPGVGVFVVIFSVGHIGTALPVMLTWLALDWLGRKWYTAVLVALLLGWALTADPLVLVVAVLPMLAVCLVRFASALVGGARDGGMAGLRAAAIDRLFEVYLAAAAGIGYLIAWSVGRFISNSGGFEQQPVPYEFDWPAWWWHARVVVHGLLEMFGAYFVPGPWINYLKGNEYLSGAPWPSVMDQIMALTHLVGVVFAVWGAVAIARRFFFRDADFVSQLLLAGIVANIAAYVPSTLANASALNVREIAPVLPFAAVLAGRMLGDRLVTGPLVSIRLPRGRRAAPGAVAADVPGPPVADAATTPSGKRPRDPRGRSLRLRLVTIPLIVLFGWYSYGLFSQAATPAAPEPLASVAAFLEQHGLKQGVGGYWEASVITVETGGAVTIRAVTPACLQPYKWESRHEWYDPARHRANFILLSQLKGYFTKFAVDRLALRRLAAWSQPPLVTSTVPQLLRQTPRSPSRWPARLKIANYTTYVYPFNLLAKMPQLSAALSSPTVNCG
jgi:hypothetical protein